VAEWTLLRIESLYPEDRCCSAENKNE
jgi:hypothetical protein